MPAYIESPSSMAGKVHSYGKAQQEVAQKIAVVRRDSDSGLPVVSERRTVKDYLESWSEMRKPSLRPDAHDNYAWHCRKYIIPAIGNVQLAKRTVSTYCACSRLD
jgi:hypothetical protein